MPSPDHVARPIALLQAFIADESSGDHLPPLHLPMIATDLADTERKLIGSRLHADQRRRDAAARRAGRDPLAEAISAHLAACARTGQQPLIATW